MLAGRGSLLPTHTDARSHHGSPATTAVLHGVASLGPCGGGPSSASCLGVQREAGVMVTVSPS
jgi:hypothetical protein